MQAHCWHGQKKAGDLTPYYTQETEQRRQFLAFAAGFLPELSADRQSLTLLAQSFLVQNNPEKCIGILQAVDHYQEIHHFLLGQAYLQLSQYETAIEHLLLGEQYDSQAAYASLELCYRALEDFKQAYFYACKQRIPPSL